MDVYTKDVDSIEESWEKDKKDWVNIMEERRASGQQVDEKDYGAPAKTKQIPSFYETEYMQYIRERHDTTLTKWALTQPRSSCTTCETSDSSRLTAGT